MEFRHTLPASDLVFGKDSLEKVGSETAKWGKRALLVTGKSSMKKLGFLDETLNHLESSGLNPIHYGEIEPNPTTEMVDAGANLALEENCNVVVALGGGSSIDAAKGIAVVAGHSDEEEVSIWDFAREGEKETRDITEKTLPVIAVPSTSGTGSHVTPFAVITNPETGGKPGFGNAPMFPKVSIVDPRIPKEMPSRLTALTGFDVFTHASESLIAAGDHPTVDPLAFAAVQYVNEYLPRAYENGEDWEAREMMAIADTYAGFSITVSSAALRHAMAHAVSGHYPDVPHGQALATLALPIMRYNIENGSEKVWRRYSKIAKALGHLDSVGKKKEDALESINVVSELLNFYGLDKSLSELGVKESKLDQMTEDTFVYMKPDVDINPVDVKKENVRDLFQESF